MSRNLLTKHVISVLKHQKDPKKALKTFNSVQNKDNFKHNVTTYKCIIENLGKNSEFEAMENMFIEMRSNVDNNSSLLEKVYISAMKSYGKKGKIQEAVNVFERMDFYNCEPSRFSYNVIMNILVEFGFFNQAHKVYLRMKDKGIVCDVYTFTIRIKAFCKDKRTFAARRLLENMVAVYGCETNSVAYCTVIGGFYDENNEVDARKVFDEMLERNVFVDVVSFNKVLHVLCKKGEVKESERLFGKMLKRSMCANVFTYNMFIQGLCKNRRFDEAANLLDFVSRQGLKPDVVTFNTLIRGLCRNGKVVEAESYLKSMINKGVEPDDFTYNTVIDGYCKHGTVERASKIMKDAVFKGFKPDKFTYLSLIYGSCREGDMDRAMSVFRDGLNKGVKPNTIMYNTLIKGLSKQGLILEALELMEEMARKQCRPDTWTYNLLIDGLCKMGCVSDASNLMNESLAKGIVPDLYTFNTLIDGYCKQLKMNDAIEIMHNMWDYVTPDAITYNIVLNGLCKTTKFDNVIGTFREMVDKGFVPNVITYNTLIESLCKGRKLDKAIEVFKEMEKNGIAPDEISYGTLIKGFCENGNLEGAFDLFQKMNKLPHTTPVFNIMIKAFSDKLKMDESLKLFNVMLENGCQYDEYTYRCMIDGFCKVGDVENGYKFLLEKIKSRLIPSVSTFGQVINCLCLSNRVAEAVGIVYIMVREDVVPDIVNTIFEADKRAVAAPKIVIEDLLRKSHITYFAYELLYDGIRDKKLLKKKIINRKTYGEVQSILMQSTTK